MIVVIKLIVVAGLVAVLVLRARGRAGARTAAVDRRGRSGRSGASGTRSGPLGSLRSRLSRPTEPDAADTPKPRMRARVDVPVSTPGEAATEVLAGAAARETGPADLGAGGDDPSPAPTEEHPDPRASISPLETISDPGWPQPGELIDPPSFEDFDPQPDALPVETAEVGDVAYNEWTVPERDAQVDWDDVDPDELGADDTPSLGESGRDPDRAPQRADSPADAEWDDDDFDPASGWTGDSLFQDPVLQSEHASVPVPAASLLTAEWELAEGEAPADPEPESVPPTEHRDFDATAWDSAFEETAHEAPVPDSSDAAAPTSISLAPDLFDADGPAVAAAAEEGLDLFTLTPLTSADPSVNVTWTNARAAASTPPESQRIADDPLAPPVIMYLRTGSEELKVVIERDEAGGPIAWVLSGSAAVDAEGPAVHVTMPTPGDEREFVASPPVEVDDLRERLAALEREIARLADTATSEPATLRTAPPRRSRARRRPDAATARGNLTAFSLPPRPQPHPIRGRTPRALLPRRAPRGIGSTQRNHGGS